MIDSISQSAIAHATSTSDNGNGLNLSGEHSPVVEESQPRRRFEFARNNTFWANMPLLTKSLLKKQEVKQEQILKDNISETEASDNNSFEQSQNEMPTKIIKPMQWVMDDDTEYRAECIKATNMGIEVGGCNYIGQWTFKNNGQSEWPRDIYFRRLRGDDVDYRVIGFELNEQGPFGTEYLTVTVDFKLPLNPGCYFLTFGLTYGFDDSL